MTALQTLLARVREIEAAATPGPWGENLMSIRPQLRTGNLDWIDRTGFGDVASCRRYDDLAFIAAARSLLIPLVEVADASQSVLRGLVGQRTTEEEDRLAAALAKLSEVL